MKFQTISLNFFFSVKGTIYYVAIAMVIFSHVKISVKKSCFRAKAHLVFHWCLCIIKYTFILPSLHTTPQDKKANQDSSLDISHQHKTANKLLISRSFFQAVL